MIYTVIKLDTVGMTLQYFLNKILIAIASKFKKKNYLFQNLILQSEIISEIYGHLWIFFFFFFNNQDFVEFIMMATNLNYLLCMEVSSITGSIDELYPSCSSHSG